MRVRDIILIILFIIQFLGAILIIVYFSIFSLVPSLGFAYKNLRNTPYNESIVPDKDIVNTQTQEPAPDPIPVTDGIKWTGVFFAPPELDGVELGLKDDGTVVWRIPKEGKFWKKEK